MLKRTKTCEVCQANVSELRRGRCWGCYGKWVEQRPVGIGALCCMCGDRRHRTLKSVEILGTWMPFCHNCAAMTAALEPMPQSLAAIREALHRERRNCDRRRGKRDSRVFRYDRRGDERRIPRISSEEINEDDEVIIDISDFVTSEDPTSLGTQSRADLTMIQQRPERPRT